MSIPWEATTRGQARGAYASGTTGPWKTIAKVNSASLKAGDSVLFMRGDTWREQLAPKSGNATGVITYGAYGNAAAPQPLLLGSTEADNTADWINIGGNIWTTASAVSTDIDVGNIIFNNGESVGWKKWSQGDLANQGDFFYDASNSTVKLYSSDNPATHYSDIELALDKNIIGAGVSQHYVTYLNLDLSDGGAHGIGTASSDDHITVNGCNISFIGGGDTGNHITRFGNGIEFWANTHDETVENCKIWEIYDAAVTNQSEAGSVSQYNITYKNNIIWDSEYSYELGLGDGVSASNIYFENNTCSGAGLGWGHAQRPDPKGRHLCFWSTTATITNLVVENNIFSESATTCIFVGYPWTSLNQLTLDYNLYYQNAGGIWADWMGTQYYTFAAYQAASGKDVHSIGGVAAICRPGKRQFSSAIQFTGD